MRNTCESRGTSSDGGTREPHREVTRVQVVASSLMGVTWSQGYTWSRVQRVSSRLRKLSAFLARVAAEPLRGGAVVPPLLGGERPSSVLVLAAIVAGVVVVVVVIVTAAVRIVALLHHTCKLVQILN